jgi:hypothetical protein
MAQKRMFSLQIVDSDAFLDMPVSSQALYFHLSMRADDDGFIDCPKKVMKIVGVSDDDMKILLAKRFILPFENGVVVIKHWKIHNYIQKDRYKETKYLEQKNKLYIKENGSYTENKPVVSKLDTECVQGGYIDKIRLDKNSIYIDLLNYFNHHLDKKFSSIDSFSANLDYWLTIYSLDDIKKAILVAKEDKWWSDKITLVKLLRRKNTQGEKVDYIGDLINRKIIKKQFIQ